MAHIPSADPADNTLLAAVDIRPAVVPIVADRLVARTGLGWGIVLVLEGGSPVESSSVGERRRSSRIVGRFLGGRCVLVRGIGSSILRRSRTMRRLLV